MGFGSLVVLGAALGGGGGLLDSAVVSHTSARPAHTRAQQRRGKVVSSVVAQRAGEDSLRLARTGWGDWLAWVGGTARSTGPERLGDWLLAGSQDLGLVRGDQGLTTKRTD